MGGLIIQIPSTICFFTISNLSLCGLPFLSGFYSKDLILEVLSINYLNIYIYLVFFISVGLTVCYTFRLIYYTLTGDFNFLPLHGLRDKGFIIIKGIFGLIFLVIFGGSILIWLMFPTPYFICLPIFIKFITLTVCFLGIWIGYQFSKFSINYSLNSMDYLIRRLFFSSIWNLPIISTFGINYYPCYLGNLIYKNFDHGWSEYLGSQNIFYRIKITSIFSQALFNNNLKVFLAILTFWIIFLIIYLFYLNSLYLEHNIEDIKEITLFLSIYKKKFLILQWKYNVFFKLYK